MYTRAADCSLSSTRVGDILSSLQAQTVALTTTVHAALPALPTIASLATHSPPAQVHLQSGTTHRDPFFETLRPSIASAQDAAHAARNERLYADETIWTLRLPAAPSEESAGETGGGVDLGPTVRPVFVKKRAGLRDVWTEQGKAAATTTGGEVGWGREIGMRVGRL